MDMNKCSFNTSGQNVAQSVVQRKFYQWVLKWINGVQSQTDANIEDLQDVKNRTKPDVPTLACFLQAIGFKLVSFEKYLDGLAKHKSEDQKSCPGVLTITLDCGTSNMKAILQLGEVTCQCPNPDNVKDASFWSISGTGPTGSIDNIPRKVEETGSNLLPRVSKEVGKVLHDVSYRLFETIACEPDHNRNTDTNLNLSQTRNTPCKKRLTPEVPKREIGVTRSHTQPEMRYRSDSLASKSSLDNHGKSMTSETSISRNSSPTYHNRPIFQRQRTWDLDTDTGSLDGEPRPSPPKITSSPAMVAELSKSLGQISLENDIQHPRDITEYIIGAHQNLEKVLKMLVVKNPSIPNDLSSHQDQDCVSVKSAPPATLPAISVSPTKLTETNAQRGLKPLSKLNFSAHKQTALGKPNGGSGIQSPRIRRSMEPIISKSTVRRSMQLDQGGTKLPNTRRSFGIPPPSGSNLSTLYSTTKKRTSPEQPQFGMSVTPKNISGTKTRTPSMLKPPTKISSLKRRPSN